MSKAAMKTTLTPMRQQYEAPDGSAVAAGDRVAVYPGPFESVTLDGERVLPQPGGFYGGWITVELVGPFKGEPGSWGW